MDIRKVYTAVRHNTGLKLRAIDALHFARQCKARDYSSPRIAESITTQAGAFFASKPTEYKTASAWNPTWSPENSRDQFRILEDCQNNSALRFVGFADEIPRFGNVDHKGWYCDNFQSEVYRGAVWQLPSRDNRPLYLAGYIEPWNDGGIICLDIIRGEVGGDQCREDYSICEAARDADSIAELFAETAREEDTKFQAEQRIETAREEIAEAREEHTATIAELRSITAQCDLFADNGAISLETIQSNPRICGAVRDTLAGYRETVRELIAEIKRLTEEPWTIDPGY